ncbi:MAG: transglutaminase-like cysteine peptidase [Alphaproteobacteria bacterium]
MRTIQFLAVSALMFATGCQTVGHQAPGQGTMGAPSASPMRTAAATLPPKGFVDFCRRFPAECSEIADPAGPVALSADRWAELEAVNRAVNRGIRYVSDQRRHGRSEYWTLPDGAGDCEDLALEKRRQLVELGWPRDSLLIALATIPRVGGHAVLVAVTDRGDFVLDVRDGRVRPWDEIPYDWVRRQSPENPRLWLSLRA